MTFHLDYGGHTCLSSNLPYLDRNLNIIIQLQCFVTLVLLSTNNNSKKKIYNVHIVINHESEARAVARWLDGVF